jgi:hypothetical protein
MKIDYRIKLGLLAFSLLYGCMKAGTHGSIKCYQFPVPKNELEIAVRSVIQKVPDVLQDSVKEYYNNDSTYVKIKIFEKDEVNEYIFHYYGDRKYWMSSKNSAISISYAHNKRGEGGSSGNGGVKWYNFKLKEELTGLFERGFINKIDEELKVNHAECN